MEDNIEYVHEDTLDEVIRNHMESEEFQILARENKDEFLIKCFDIDSVFEEENSISRMFSIVNIIDYRDAVLNQKNLLYYSLMLTNIKNLLNINVLKSESKILMNKLANSIYWTNLNLSEKNELWYMANEINDIFESMNMNCKTQREAIDKFAVKSQKVDGFITASINLKKKSLKENN